MDFESLFHFSHHCGIGNFRRFVSISHQLIFCDTWQNDSYRQDNESATFWERSGRHPDPDLFGNPDPDLFGNPESNLGSDFGLDGVVFALCWPRHTALNRQTLVGSKSM